MDMDRYGFGQARPYIDPFSPWGIWEKSGVAGLPVLGLLSSDHSASHREFSMYTIM